MTGAIKWDDAFSLTFATAFNLRGMENAVFPNELNCKIGSAQSTISQQCSRVNNRQKCLRLEVAKGQSGS